MIKPGGIGIRACGTSFSAVCRKFEKSPAVGEQTWFQLSIVPFALGILRYALLLSQGQGDAPEDVVLSDRVLLGLGAVWVVCFAIAVRSG